MIIRKNIKGYDCHLATHKGAEKVVYLIYPELVEFKDEWLERMSEHLRENIIAVYVPADDWNDSLTPWPEPGETKTAPPFGGKSEEFLKILQTGIIPEMEKTAGLEENVERDLLGVSLGGLFTLWQWIMCDTFKSISCLSGSFWYEGFLEWFQTHSDNLASKTGKAYFLLGEEEPHSHIKAFQSVGENTETIVEKLKNMGIKTEFEWVPGNHFSDPVHRAQKGLEGLQ